MDSITAAKLVALNRQFYADFGTHFSATRGRIQPGVRKIIQQLRGDERILDLGCGNGELARTLAQTGFHGEYLGLDFSLPLLTDAESQPGAFPVKFLAVDLTADWSNVIASDRRERSNLLNDDRRLLRHTCPGGRCQGKPPRNDIFDLVFSFAVLHHIPGADLRLDILKKARALLVADGKFIHSEWQFLNSPKLAARIQPWERAELSAADVDEGDTLLDWRSGGLGLRYVHHFSVEELSQLAGETGFRVVESFLSDGENGKLGLYQTWEGQ